MLAPINFPGPVGRSCAGLVAGICVLLAAAVVQAASLPSTRAAFDMCKVKLGGDFSGGTAPVARVEVSEHGPLPSNPFFPDSAWVAVSAEATLADGSTMTESVSCLVGMERGVPVLQEFSTVRGYDRAPKESDEKTRAPQRGGLAPSR